MKKSVFGISGLFILCIMAGFLLSACALLTSPERPGYQAGRTFVFVDTVKGNFLPAEVDMVIDQVYVLAQMDLSADDITDELVKSEINQLCPDATQEVRDTMYLVYVALEAKLLVQIDANIDLPDIAIIDNFFAGVRDALAIYQPPEE